MVLEEEGQNLGPVPSFGSATFNFNLRTRSLFDNFSDTVTASIGGQKYTKDITVKPFIIFQTIPLIAIGVISLMGVTYLVVLGGLVYRKRFLKAEKLATKK